MGRPLIHRSPIPGLGISAGITITLLSLVVLLPIGALLLKGAVAGPERLWAEVNTPRIWASLWLSFRLSFLAALFNLIFGVALAWVLGRYRFPGRRLIDAAVDLPFALPTAVAGIALTAIYAPNGAFGMLAKDLGFKIAYTPVGIFIALVFVGLPFVVRTVQPVIDEIEREVEEASATLGASRTHTLRHVVLARAVGEYGSVIFIAGNLPMKTEIAPLLIVIKLEEFNYEGATAIGIAMLLISFSLLLLINGVQVWSRRRIGYV